MLINEQFCDQIFEQLIAKLVVSTAYIKHEMTKIIIIDSQMKRLNTIVYFHNWMFN
jgi:hypothetical protein